MTSTCAVAVSLTVLSLEVAVARTVDTSGPGRAAVCSQYTVTLPRGGISAGSGRDRPAPHRLSLELTLVSGSVPRLPAVNAKMTGSLWRTYCTFGTLLTDSALLSADSVTVAVASQRTVTSAWVPVTVTVLVYGSGSHAFMMRVTWRTAG